MIFAGIDSGSRAVKIVLIDDADAAVVGSAVADQGIEQRAIVSELLDGLLKGSGLHRDDLAGVVATGYGRDNIDFADTTITEITCHACGVHHVVPEAATVIEVGGQDSKLLRLEPNGTVRDFVMNDRCAAGTGRFLEVVAARLGIGLDELGALAVRSRKPAAISSMCVVFAETETIGLLADGCLPEDIVAGVQHAIATRVHAMAGRNVTLPVVFTGGVAMIPGMAAALADVIGCDITVVPTPQMTGALGAALVAARRG